MKIHARDHIRCGISSGSALLAVPLTMLKNINNCEPVTGTYLIMIIHKPFEETHKLIEELDPAPSYQVHQKV